MKVAKQRKIIIAQTIEQIRVILIGDDSSQGMAKAADVLASLARHDELFPRDEFPVPTGEHSDKTYRLRQDADGKFALYVNSGSPGQSFRPHDHGASWGIVAAVEGRELHRIYDRVDDGSDDENAQLELNHEIELKPGQAVALPIGTIHSIRGVGDQAILHLHLYGIGYHLQEGRTEFDLSAGKAFYIKNKYNLDADEISFDG